MNVAEYLSTWEKGHYPFAAYPKNTCKSVFFPGCSMVSQFPRTTDALSELCRRLGMGVAYDCCGSSVASSGREGLAERVLCRLRNRLARIGCEEVVVVCPNCHAYLSRKLGIRCVSIYQKLLTAAEGSGAMGLRAAVEACACGGTPVAEGVLFTPCPDRASKAWETQVRMLMDLGRVHTLDKVPCCGLRPDIACRGVQTARKLDQAIFQKADGKTIWTTCASCAGQFVRMGYEGQVRHVLGVYLGIDETPDATRAIANRARRKFDKNLEPLGRG